MTPSAPDISSADTAFSNEVISPLTTSGIVIASLTARTALALVDRPPRGALPRDHRAAGRFPTARHFGGVERGPAPAEPHLQRHRHFHGRYRRLDQSHGVIEIAHQCRAGLAAGHMPRRTAHVDIDDVGAGGLGDPRAFRHPPDLAARELNDMRTYSGRLASQP